MPLTTSDVLRRMGLGATRRSWRVVVTALSVLSATLHAQGSGINPRRIDGIARAMRDSGFSGVVLVAVGDSIVLHRAYCAAGPPLSTSSEFRIASITKSFTAAAILELQRRDRLTIRDSIARFFPDAPSDKGAITVAQLLTHTAGFAVASTGAGITTRDSAVRAILGRPLTYAPGKGYEYGNDDYELLAAVIEVASGQSWTDFIKRAFITPIGLHHTSAAADDWGHRGANGMTSTALDLFRWTRALDDTARLGGDVVAALREPRTLVRREGAADVYVGFGSRVYRIADTTTEIMYSGLGEHGHTGIIRRLPGGLTVIVLSNAGQHGGTTWSAYLAQQLRPRP